jgi:dipeptidyl aminopeptidase/acylaminoacyl peptidase
LLLQKTPVGWTEIGGIKSNQAQGNRITITLEEDMNTPPNVYASNLKTGRKSLLLELNPRFRQFEFGRVQNITFTATDRHKVSAGLYLPPDYVQGKKYPLVIQTHAWNPERFWIDGPWPTAFAAQPLASKGFVVLQLDEDTNSLSTPEEAGEEASAYEGSIDYLDALGIVDRDRVGLVGFSRTGLGVEYALTHSKYHFAAATIADGSDGGYFAYLSVLASFTWRWPDFEDINGGAPFGNGLKSWLKYSPGFNLDKVTTPVREEAYERSSLLFVWE